MDGEIAALDRQQSARSARSVPSSARSAEERGVTWSEPSSARSLHDVALDGPARVAPPSTMQLYTSPLARPQVPPLPIGVAATSKETAVVAIGEISPFSNSTGVSAVMDSPAVSTASGQSWEAALVRSVSDLQRQVSDLQATVQVLSNSSQASLNCLQLTDASGLSCSWVSDASRQDQRTVARSPSEEMLLRLYRQRRAQIKDMPPSGATFRESPCVKRASGVNIQRAAAKLAARTKQSSPVHSQSPFRAGVRSASPPVACPTRADSASRQARDNRRCETVQASPKQAVPRSLSPSVACPIRAGSASRLARESRRSDALQAVPQEATQKGKEISHTSRPSNASAHKRCQRQVPKSEPGIDPDHAGSCESKFSFLNNSTSSFAIVCQRLRELHRDVPVEVNAASLGSSMLDTSGPAIRELGERIRASLLERFGCLELASNYAALKLGMYTEQGVCWHIEDAMKNRPGSSDSATLSTEQLLHTESLDTLRAALPPVRFSLTQFGQALSDVFRLGIPPRSYRRLFHLLDDQLIGLVDLAKLSSLDELAPVQDLDSTPRLAARSLSPLAAPCATQNQSSSAHLTHLTGAKISAARGAKAGVRNQSDKRVASNGAVFEAMLHDNFAGMLRSSEPDEQRQARAKTSPRRGGQKGGAPPATTSAAAAAHAAAAAAAAALAVSSGGGRRGEESAPEERLLAFMAEVKSQQGQGREGRSSISTIESNDL